MDEKMGATPNPLNPNNNAASGDHTLDANPAEPMNMVGDASGGVGSNIGNRVGGTSDVVKPLMTPKVSTRTTASPVGRPASVTQSTLGRQSMAGEVDAGGLDASTQSVTLPDGAEAATVQIESLSPTGRPMEQAMAVASPKKKKKTGLIVSIIIALVVLIGGGIAAAVVLINMNKPDAVAVAIDKMITEGLPDNVAIDGSIDILINNSNSPIKRINTTLDSNIMTGTAINTSSALLTLTLRDDHDYSIEFDEIYAANGDLFFKIDGATAALEDSGLFNQLLNLAPSSDIRSESDKLKTPTDEGAENTPIEPLVASAGIILDLIETVDGNWLRISVEQLGLVGYGGGDDSIASCMVNVMGDIAQSSNSIAQAYKKYPFIKSEKDSVLIASKANPVYQVAFNNDNLIQFMGAIQGSQLSKDLTDCINQNNTNTTNIAQSVASLPKIYVEIDGNNNFTRLYLESDLDNNEATVVVDLGLSYPKNVNVTEPVEYTDFSEMIQEFMVNMFNMPGVEIDNESATMETRS